MQRLILLIGTKRGLFIARSDETRRAWALSAPQLVGREIYHAMFDARTGTCWAASDHKVWGAHIHRSTDMGETWETLEAAPHYEDKRGLKAIWFLAPGADDKPEQIYAGIEPAGMFVSDDAGGSWKPVKSINDHKTSKSWQAAGGALVLHSIQHDPRTSKRMYCAVSAGGVYRSEDGGTTWTPINSGTRAAFLPDDRPPHGQCVHKLLMHPGNPDRLYQQNHCGTYRSDDRGDNWLEITSDLPSDYGYALAVDPRDPDYAFIVPETSSDMRATIGGKLRAYRTRDGGRSWQALTRGLPQEHAYLSILREGLVADAFEPTGLYMGTTGGQLFASRDGGESWKLLFGYLPKVLSVQVGVD